MSQKPREPGEHEVTTLQPPESGAALFGSGLEPALALGLPLLPALTPPAPALLAGMPLAPPEAAPAALVLPPVPAGA